MPRFSLRLSGHLITTWKKKLKKKICFVVCNIFYFVYNYIVRYHLANNRELWLENYYLRLFASKKIQFRKKKLVKSTGCFIWKVEISNGCNSVTVHIEKICHLSNAFWLYQHRVKYAPLQSYSHLKFPLFKWNTL